MQRIRLCTLKKKDRDEQRQTTATRQEEMKIKVNTHRQFIKDNSSNVGHAVNSSAA